MCTVPQSWCCRDMVGLAIAAKKPGEGVGVELELHRASPQCLVRKGTRAGSVGIFRARTGSAGDVRRLCGSGAGARVTSIPVSSSDVMSMSCTVQRACRGERRRRGASRASCTPSSRASSARARARGGQRPALGSGKSEENPWNSGSPVGERSRGAQLPTDRPRLWTADASARRGCPRAESECA